MNKPFTKSFLDDLLNQRRADDVLSRVLPEKELYCIGLTKDGFPKHPLMAAYTQTAEKYR